MYLETKVTTNLRAPPNFLNCLDKKLFAFPKEVVAGVISFKSSKYLLTFSLLALSGAPKPILPTVKSEILSACRVA